MTLILTASSLPRPLFRSESGNPGQPSIWWKIWQKVRPLLWSLDQLATPLLRRPYDLRHSEATWRLIQEAVRRGSRLGEAQRRNADARLRQVYDRAGRCIDQPLRGRLILRVPFGHG
jgi:hypothetical protein